MDFESLIEALRGTMDPNLREAAERQLNEVKVELNVMVIAVVARSRLGPRPFTTSRWCDHADGVPLPLPRYSKGSIPTLDGNSVTEPYPHAPVTALAPLA